MKPKIYYPNPDIETRIRVRLIDAYSESKKYRVTLLVMRCFLDLLEVSRDCAINVFSMSGLGYYKNCHCGDDMSGENHEW